MAEFRADGLDRLIFSMAEVASMPVELQDEILNAGADVLAPVLQAKVRQYGIYDMDNTSTRHVADSIQKSKPKTKKGVRVIYITPKGSRKRGKTTTRNAEILFVNEFGKRGQQGRPAIRDAVELTADRVAEAELEVWDNYLKEHDL